MKHLLLMLSLGMVFSVSVVAQNHFDPNQERYTTDPDIPKTNPTLYNQNYKKNTFDWTEQFHYLNKRLYNNTYLPASGATQYFNGPYEDVTSDYLINHLFENRSGQVYKNYHPRDGWELLRRDFGYLWDADGNRIPANLKTIDINNKDLPYMIVYNKYTSVLRILANLPEIDGPAMQPDYVNVSLSIDQSSNPGLYPSTAGYYKPTGIFAFYGTGSDGGAEAAALDKETKVLSVSSNAKWLGNHRWFFADFIMAYDPCTCFNPSAITVRFKAVKNAEIKLKGRFYGTGVPIQNIIENEDQIPEGTEYLSAAFNNGQDFTTVGVVANGNLQEAIDQYNTLYQEYLQSTVAPELTLFQQLLNAGLDALDALTGDLASNAIGNIVDIISEEKLLEKINQGIPLNASEQELKAYYDKMRKISPVFNYFSSTLGINTQASPGYMPVQPMLIYGEMALNGNLELSSDLVNHKIDMANPGSYGSQNYPEFPGACHILTGQSSCTQTTAYPAYTLYNEPLGIFSLLKTPKVYVYDVSPGARVCGAVFNPNVPIYNQQMEAEFIRKFKVDVSSLSYMFNPSLNVDESRSSLEASLIVDVAKAGSSYTVNPSGFIGPLPSKDQTTDQFISDFKPLNCLSSNEFSLYQSYSCRTGAQPAFGFNVIKVSVKLKMHIAFKPNPNYPSAGSKLHELVVTYPVELINGAYYMFSPVTGPNTPLDVLVEYQTFNSNTDIVANRSIAVRGEIIVNNNSRVRLFAPKVDIETYPDDFTSIPPGVEIGPGMSTTCIPVTSALSTLGFNPGAYCSSSNYKASVKSPSALRTTFDDEALSVAETAYAKEWLLNLYPNPGKDKVNILIDLAEDGKVSVDWIDLTGRKVMSSFADLSYGKHEFLNDVSALEPGLYFVRINYNNEFKTVYFMKE